MPNDMQIKQADILARRRVIEPEAFERQGIIFWLLAAMVGTRLLYAILFTMYFNLLGFRVPTSEYVMTYFMVLIALLFAFIIYQGGQKFAAYLGLFGGVFSLFRAFTDGVFFMIGTVDAILSSIMLIFVATIIIQIVTMAFICFDSKCRLYMQMRAEVSKEMQEWVKANKQQ